MVADTAPTSGSTTSIPVAATPSAGFWEREASHFPQPLSPAMRIFLEWENAIWRNLAVKHGMMFDGIEFQEIGGWVYQRLRPLGGKDRRPPPGWLMWLLVRTAPPIRARLKQLREALSDDLAMQSVDLWLSTWKTEQIARIAELRAVDLPRLPAAEFETHLDRVLAFGEESLRRHFELTMPIATVAELAFFCQETLGWSDGEALDLLAGL